MSGWGWFILVIILLIPLAYIAFILYRRFQAKRDGTPLPPFNPFAHSEPSGSQIYPAPSGLVGWAKNKYHAVRGSHASRSGAYEATSLGGPHRRAGGGLDPDEAWDARVGAEADGYGSGGYYEEQELGLRPMAPATAAAAAGRNDYAGGGYGNDGSLPTYGHDDMGRGRSLSRNEGGGDTAYVGGGQRGLDRRYDEEMQGGPGESGRENPFGDDKASSMRGVSPRPHVEGEGDGHKKHGSGGGLAPDDSPTERRSMFREEQMNL